MAPKVTATSDSHARGRGPPRPPLVVLLAALALAACATTASPTAPGAGRPGAASPPGDGPGSGPRSGGRRTLVGEGRASYYSNIFNGRRTASGERYDPERLTAAHKSLPLGTWVRVTRTDGRWVEVKVNDRCGCGGGHIIDLSRAAARKLDMIHSGTAAVRVEIVER